MEQILCRIESSWEGIKDSIDGRLGKEISEAIELIRRHPTRALPVARSEYQRFEAMCESFQQNNYPLGVFCMLQNYMDLVGYLTREGA